MLNTPGQDDHDSDLELDFGDAAQGLDDDCAPLDDTKEQVGYELFDWDPTDLDELDDALHELGLPHEWLSEGYEVVIHEEHERQVDALLPTIRFPDELPPEEDDGDDTDIEVLSALFVAADRLHRDPTGDPVTSLLDAAEQVAENPPYGVDEKEWDNLVARLDELIDALHAAAPPAAVAELALDLRVRLRPLI